MNGRGSLLAGATLFEVAPTHVDEGSALIYQLDFTLQDQLRKTA